MAESREAKRVRQACQNCRRKKTRCSGEKPVCSFCARLKQDCLWDEVSTAALYTSNVNLAARVALLESKLSLLNSDGNDGLPPLIGDGYAPSKKRRTSAQEGSVSPEENSDNSQRSQSRTPEAAARKFIQLPPEPVLHAILHTFFARCHKQPYAYFRPEYFYWKLDSGEIPEYLLLAMTALAARFSTDPFFEGRPGEVVDRYTRTAWSEIFEKSFSEDYVLDIHAVQATHMLAIVDFTAGRAKLGWQKVGLAVRFAQSLELGSGIPTHFTPEQQEEQRLTFWSMYLLDRLVSCGTSRPPTISDIDCAIPLASDITPPNETESSTVPDLRALFEISGCGANQSMDLFAQTILMASVLGRIERHSLQHQSSKDRFPPWDSRSDFAAIYSMLLNFEAQSEITTVSLSSTIGRHIGPDGLHDHAAAGHLAFSTILYHMNQCLLHHPFLLRKRLDSCPGKHSPSFLREARRRSLEHAYQLTGALRAVQNQGFNLSSFYAYAMIVAGSIHRLFMHHDDEWTRRTARQLFDYSLGFLDSGNGVWEHYARIATALRSFRPNPSSARALVTTPPNEQHSHDPDLDVIWNLLDYGWLSDAARPVAGNDAPPLRRPTVTGEEVPKLHQTPATAPTSDTAYSAFEDFDLNKPFSIHDEVAMDFMTYPDGTVDSWPDVLHQGDVFLSTDFGISSPWNPRAAG
ncbi:hypothetical protein A1O3_10204 [Capronia epimyces CBS 606.96]|uniref:Zn(2)-C6 fungal-type domain-containing protein n=1 Tax=Capronia epimyces CBS 606.96 TaxID=1182542 RepID=W9XJ96_9EURO|nr:uncharacterized protein A1O3_10204 [Capronia epimyces CBS 606.96]EXJ77046.1 hypothetical protein A1O3_10204 [Capronia epimyces CBS 606.96]